MYQSAKMKPMKSALLVIDVQDSFKALSRWEHRNNPAFESNLLELIADFRSRGEQVIYILHTDPDPAFTKGNPAYKLMDFLEPLPHEPTFEKSSRNCFTSTALAQYLTQNGISKLVITGIQTEQCCETTARVAGDLGYSVDFVTDATRTFPIKHWELEEWISTTEITKATEYHLAGRFARIVGTSQFIAEGN